MEKSRRSNSKRILNMISAITKVVDLKVSNLFDEGRIYTLLIAQTREK